MEIRNVKVWRLAAAFGVLAVGVALAAPALNGAGASFPYPLYTKWIDVYGKGKGVEINYSSVGSGKGIRALLEQTVDFAGSDAPLSDAEQKEMPGKVIHIPTVAGAVAIAYNMNLSKPLKLDAATLAGIFLGEIKTWDDPRLKALNPGVAMPARNIVVCRRSDSSGTTYCFTEYLSLVSSKWRTAVGHDKSVKWPVGLGAPKNDGVAGLIAKNPGALGYVELAYATQAKLKVAQLKNKKGEFVTPSLASTTKAMAGFVADLERDVRNSINNSGGSGAYPICTMTYLLLYQRQKDAAKAKTLLDFVGWAITTGQQYAAPLLYARLPQELVEINQKALKTVQY